MNLLIQFINLSLILFLDSIYTILLLLLLWWWWWLFLRCFTVGWMVGRRGFSSTSVAVVVAVVVVTEPSTMMYLDESRL
jgi:hypothetical protein